MVDRTAGPLTPSVRVRLRAARARVRPALPSRCPSVGPLRTFSSRKSPRSPAPRARVAPIALVPVTALALSLSIALSACLTFVNGRLCSTASMFALCGEARYVVGAVGSGGAGGDVRTVASWHVGATVGVGFDFAALK